MADKKGKPKVSTNPRYSLDPIGPPHVELNPEFEGYDSAETAANERLKAPSQREMRTFNFCKGGKVISHRRM
jgi:hypothetical protein